MKEKESLKTEYSIVLVKPHLGRIFLARLIDLILCSLPMLLLTIFNPIHDLKTLLINIPVSQLCLFLYFVFLPTLWKGNTLGKLILKLRLKNEDNSKIKLRIIFLREFYFIYVPLLFQITIQIIMGIIIYTSEANDSLYTMITLINNIGYAFLAMWFIYIPLTIYLQKENISAIDLKLKTRVYFLEKKLVVEKKETEKIHVHLANERPGKIDMKEINKLLGESDE